MSYSNSNLIGPNVTDTFVLNTVTAPEYPRPPFAVGQRTFGTSNSEYVFVSNTEATAQVVGDVVFLNAAQGTCTRLSTSNDARGQMVGVCVSAIPATTGNNTGYGWVQVKGTCAAISVLASCAANVRINTTATAGALDDDGTAGSFQVQGIYLTTARGASPGTAPGVLNYPFVDGTL